MVRNYKRKTGRAASSVEDYEKAAVEVQSGRCSLRKAGEMLNVNRMSLLRFINKRKENPSGCIEMGYQKPRMVFTSEQELQLCDYAIQSANIFYGISPSELRSLAYEFAVANKIKIPENWSTKKTASSDWMTKFMKRHKNICLRVPEATSLSRNTSFNKHNVTLFFDNLSNILDKHQFSAKDIWNIDETGTGTVQKPVKIIAEKGKKRVGGMTSAERGANVTMVFGVNAVGNSVPPMFIFPRKFYKEHFIRDGPVGCYGSANPSGWITGPDFLLFIKHFVINVRCSKESPLLVMLDNHASHLHIDVLDYCKDHGIILLSFPPHTTHRLQPLDVSVFGPFKRFYNEAACGWMKSHPGSTISIYDVPSIVKIALPLAATPKNIQAGFRCTGIWELNRNIFTDEDYLGSSVTDRPQTTENEVVRHEEKPGTSTANRPSENAIGGTCSVQEGNEDVNCNTMVVQSPIDMRPLPKSGPRQNKRARKSLKSAILTSTPIKEAIRLEQMERDERKKKKEETARKKLFEKEKKLKTNKTRKHIVNLVDSESSEDEDCYCLVCLKPYNESKKGEDWVQCLSCKKWSHVSCTKNEPFYVCVHCHSGADNDTDDSD